MSQLAHKQQSIPSPHAGQSLSIEQMAVDRLGAVQAEIAPLTTEADNIKKMLRATGMDVIEGTLFRATISLPEPSVKVDWEAVANAVATKSGISQKAYGQIINANTKIGEQGAARVSVKARKGV